jgi:UDP-glucose 4-epimerase
MKLEIAGDGFLAQSLRDFFGLNVPSLVVQEGMKRTHLLGVDGREVLLKYFQDSEVSHFINASGPSSVHHSFNLPYVYENEPQRQVRAHLELLSELKSPPNYIFVSSAAVYGESPLTGSKEDDLCHPLSPYGFGKLNAEEYLKDHSGAYSGKIIVLRVFSAYGNLLKKQIPFVISTQIRENSKINLFGSGSEKRDFIHISDIGFAIQQILSSAKPDQISTFNVGSGKSTSIAELASIASNAWQKIASLQVPISFSNVHKTGDPVNLTADISNLSKINFVPTISAEAGFMSYFDSTFR